MENFTDVEIRILSRMKELRLKQLDICQETGLSTTAVSNYCTGKRLPDTLSLYKISRVLDVSMEWILTGENKTTEESRQINHSDDPLKEEEADLVTMYRLLPSYVREDMFDQVHCLYRKYAERKKESIYWTYKEDKLKQKDEVDSDGSSQGGIA